MGRVVGIDVGGTFTDVVVFEDDGVRGFKVPTTPDQGDAISGAVDWEGEDVLLHGTTAATNALLEERGARVGLVTDSGYEDLIEIARQDRPSLYDSSVDRPVPLVARSNRYASDDPPGEAIDADIVVVGLIEGYLNPSVEQAMATRLRSELAVPVIAATDISPEFREYERLATAVLSAYLTPSVAEYLGGLDRSVPAQRRLVMTSAGGLLPFARGASSAARLVLSGPAGGVVAAAALARHHGYDEVITFDMGGTSTDVSRISGGQPTVGSGHRVAGRVNRVPSVPVRTIGAGGGSVGWVDPGGALRVGPRSAGANPGPAAYGQGGTEPTVTDANLFLGHIAAGPAFGDAFQLDVELSRAALARLGEQMGMGAEEVAIGMLEVVDSHMEHALRAVSVEEGVDPRDTVLVAFGGAGALHASRLAHRLGVPKVLVPPLSGVFSALGLLLAVPMADSSRTFMLAEGAPLIAEHSAAMVQAAASEFTDLFGSRPVDSRVAYDCRYYGQSHELEVQAGPDWGEIRTAFEDSHRRHFGFDRPEEPIEVVNIRARATGTPPLTWGDVIGGASGTPPALLLSEADVVRTLDDGTLEITCG